MKLALYFAIFLHLYNLSISTCWPNFYFYSSKESRHIYNLTTTGSLKHTGFDRNLPTIFVVHGFGSSGLAPRIRRMKSAFHRYTQVNTIAVDWKEGATAFKDPIFRAVYYIRAIVNLRAVGQAISTFVQSNEIDPSLITCVGHSLGAHGCGFAGKEYFAQTNNKLGRIVGLDPAGPLFQFFSIVIPSQLRLDSSDASFVDCIYTSTYNGIVQPICHANFYPNALRGQPHCIGDDEACLHEAAVSYFIESIQPPNTQCSFIANECDFFRFDCNLLFSAVKSQMGFYASEFSHARGLFVLNTNSTLPYCLK